MELAPETNWLISDATMVLIKSCGVMGQATTTSLSQPTFSRHKQVLGLQYRACFHVYIEGPGVQLAILNDAYFGIGVSATEVKLWSFPIRVIYYL